MLAFLLSPIGKALGAAVVAVGVISSVFLYGKSVGRQESRVEAVNEALERIETMEKNNEDFLALPDRERCLVFMRDSGLPVEECDQR